MEAYIAGIGGKPEIRIWGKIMAFDKKEYQKKWYERNRERLLEKSRINQKNNMKRHQENCIKWRKNHKELGLCGQCNKPKHKWLSLCLEHHRRHLKANVEYLKRHPNRTRERGAKKRKLCKETGRCPKCYGTLRPDMDNGRVQCLNCREGIHTPRRQHGNIIF